MKFYTNVSQIGNFIYHRWIEDGKRKEAYTDFVDIDLYTPTNEETPYKTFFTGQNLKQTSFAKIRDAKQFINDYSDVSNMEIHGNRNWWAQFIAKEYPTEIDYDESLLVIANIDIETSLIWDDGGQGFPDPHIAPAKITAITVEINGKYDIFGMKEYTKKLPDNTNFHKFDSESDMLYGFLEWWQHKKPDVVTGWNIEGFDIPYIINRSIKLLGKLQAAKLSPAWRYVKSKGIEIREKTLDYSDEIVHDYIIHGTAVNDLLKLYRFYTFKLREKYSLDHISHIELGEKKLKYDEMKNTFELLEGSEHVKIPKDKKPEEMEDFVRWCRMRDLLKAEKAKREIL